MVVHISNPALKRLGSEAILGYIMNLRLTWATQSNPVSKMGKFKHLGVVHWPCFQIKHFLSPIPFSLGCLDQKTLASCHTSQEAQLVSSVKKGGSCLSVPDRHLSEFFLIFPPCFHSTPPPHSHTLALHSFPFHPFKKTPSSLRKAKNTSSAFQGASLIRIA